MQSPIDRPAEMAGIGPHAAMRIVRRSVPPPELQLVKGNNAATLRKVAFLIVVMCDGRPGMRFFLGGDTLGKLLGVPAKSALRWLAQLERQRIITRTWRGGLVIRDQEGREYAGGELVKRASEYTFNGLCSAKCFAKSDTQSVSSLPM